ncbi:hypothetical protein D3C84_750530 [compost metagenome]
MIDFASASVGVARCVADGQANQLITVRSSASAPRPSQVCCKPRLNSGGTIVPDPAMPSPIPRKIAPLARPLREAGTCGNTVPATSTMIAPPAMPDSRRQPKNQLTDNGNAQAKNARVTASIIRRRAVLLEVRRASG